MQKIVSGGYAQEGYLDRSMGAIGDNKKYDLDSVNRDLVDKDKDVVRQRLDVIKHSKSVMH